MRIYEINRYQFEDKEYSKWLGDLNKGLRKAGLKNESLSAYKSICSQMREQICTENILLLCTENNGEITIIEFDHKADGLIHSHYFEEGKGYYI
ncbi:hypothetical protein G9F71_008595 [Clostridium sp. FP2]|uniref:hypothetical protein n=1 Tax=Clostridium sp. FP2 TaxID=2724481 RepID=UPI0013E95935|nr:hypothetical protein [Clostridium sp. FP2]MBZ9622911.1 hypothetical protein [Clostridium sp. FP2]